MAGDWRKHQPIVLLVLWCAIKGGKFPSASKCRHFHRWNRKSSVFSSLTMLVPILLLLVATLTSGFDYYEESEDYHDFGEDYSYHSSTHSHHQTSYQRPHRRPHRRPGRHTRHYGSSSQSHQSSYHNSPSSHHGREVDSTSVVDGNGKIWAKIVCP